MSRPPKLTKAQRTMLVWLGQRVLPLDRREVLSRADWDVCGRLQALGLAHRNVFEVRITEEGRAFLAAKATRAASDFTRSDQQTASDKSRALSPLPNVPVDGRLRGADTP